MNKESIYYNYVVAGLILIAGVLLGFWLGKLDNSNNPAMIVIDKNIKIGMPERQNSSAGNNNNLLAYPENARYVASINGSAYYPVDCKSAERIKEENRIWFISVEEAETQGYKLAQNCR